MFPRSVRVGLSMPVAALLAFSAGCADDAGDNDPALGGAGLSLTYDILDDTDVSSMQFTVTEVDCDTGDPVVPANVHTAIEEFVDGFIPGGDPSLEGSPYDPESGHIFSDHFFWLPEGCYDIHVQPLQEDGSVSEDCASATMSNVAVHDGATAEVHLISQCVGDPAGGLDVIASINHPPQIVGLTYDPSKFVCDENAVVCMTVWDPDNDPVSFDLFTPPGATIVNTWTEPLDDATVACAEFAFEGPGVYQFGATVYDMGYDDDGNLVTIEELLAAQGDPHPSHDSIRFPVHVLDDESCIETCECPEGFEPTPAGDECIRVTEREPRYSETQWQVCKGERNRNYGKFGGQYPDGLIELTPFFGEAYDYNGRLNDVGVWACDPDSIDTGETYPTTEPTGEWIGFATCLDVEEAGDYMIGIAADNRLRITLNGTQIVNFNTNDTDNFTYWWMNTVSLNSGLNIIELEGYNQSQAAAFGAEIYGDFPAGSLVNDAAMSAADYEGNILWSTLDVIGEPFTLGEFSGMQCPDGWALNTCGDKPTCTLIERVACR